MEKDARNYSKKANSSISEAGLSFKTEDLPSISFRSVWVFFIFCYHYSSEMFSFTLMN
ncbi:hypothetical protein F383_02214 [Gossypium arboreum]|uniref:Uncharacterized protein n=1 Tax=Gossypium arboreum TaxID=29729 RepID=A0A0B0PHH4_GOSAR|nr:hypothetical protein F383_02214 [Gossypium arboreum]